jgi:hypothetical protein
MRAARPREYPRSRMIFKARVSNCIFNCPLSQKTHYTEEPVSLRVEPFLMTGAAVNMEDSVRCGRALWYFNQF